MIYSQRDPRWANQRLGTKNGVTIGSDGCFVTSAAIVLTHYGHVLNPSQLDNLLTDRGLYVAQDLFVDSSLHALFPDVELERVWNFVGIPADLSTLTMNEQEEVILVLDFDHNPADGIQTHAVRVYDYRNGIITVDDPWYGTRDNFTTHYGNFPSLTIQKVIKYIKRDYHIAPPVDTSAAQIADLKIQLAAANQQLANYKAAIATWVQTFPK